MSKLHRRLVLAVAVTCTVPLATLPTVAAEEAVPAYTAGPVVRLSEDGLYPSVAVDDAGATTVVWATRWRHGPIYASRRPPGGKWRDPIKIAVGTEPRVATDGDGNVTVLVETNRKGSTTGLAVVERPAGGSWRDPVRLSVDKPARYYTGDGEGAYGAHRSDFQVNEAGDAVVVWQWGSADRSVPFRIEAVRRPAGGHWGDPVPLTPRNWSEDPKVALDASGDATIVYGRGWNAGTSSMTARRFVVGHGWQVPERLARRNAASEWDVVSDRGGNTTVVFSRYRRGISTIHAVRHPVGRSWVDRKRISPRGVNIWSASPVVDAAGNVWVAWARRSGRIDATLRPAHAPWRAPTQVAPPERGGTSTAVEVNADGDLVVLWDEENADGDPQGLTARVRQHTGGWTPMFGVTAVPYPWYDAAVYREGDVIVTWMTDRRGVDLRRFLER